MCSRWRLAMPTRPALSGRLRPRSGGRTEEEALELIARAIEVNPPIPPRTTTVPMRSESSSGLMRR